VTTAKERFRAERNAEILRLAKLGVRSTEIARITRVSLSLVQRLRTESGLAASRRPTMSQEQKDRAHHLLLDGASRREAARSVGCSEDQLYRTFPDLHWDREQLRLAHVELNLYGRGRG
jgi:DNA invertase Pin-like site-specific DNA recombinase